MRIAQVSLLHDTVAPWPSSNAGRAASYLIEELVSEGHEVTLFSSDDWETSAPLVRLREIEQCESREQHLRRMVASVQRRAQYFDIVHLHCDRPDFPSTADPKVPSVATVHAPCGILERADSAMALIPTSRRQPSSAGRGSRKPIELGLPRDLHAFREPPGAHLAFNGPISRDSGIQCAVQIAARAGLQLKVACEVPPQDRSYFCEIFVPMLHSDSQVQWLGEVGDRSRNELLGGARALLAACDRSGAFDLQVVEALACGTPVIAWADTAAADIIQDGVSGFVVRSTDEAVKAVAKNRRTGSARLSAALRGALRRAAHDQPVPEPVSHCYPRVRLRHRHGRRLPAWP